MKEINILQFENYHYFNMIFLIRIDCNSLIKVSQKISINSRLNGIIMMFYDYIRITKIILYFFISSQNILNIYLFFRCG